MGVKYSIKPIKNPGRPDESPLFYPQAQVREQINIYQIAREIEYGTSLTEGDVLNVIHALISRVKNHLANGDNVSLGEFGSIQYQIKGKGATSIETFNSKKHIEGVRFHFRPGKYMREAMEKLTYDYVIPKRAHRQAKREEKEKLSAVKLEENNNL